MSKCHILLMDPLEKLSLKKDSTALLAWALKSKAHQVYLLFEKDFCFSNKANLTWDCYDFSAALDNENPSYIKSFELGERIKIEASENIVFHMRVDPPFDGRYLRYLWMLKGLKSRFGVSVLNDPSAICANNEKMISYELEHAVSTYVGSSDTAFLTYFNELKSDPDYCGLIFKPLDLFQGIGVKKVELDSTKEEVLALFKQAVKEYEGPVVAQPYIRAVEKGEIRSIYFAGTELGSIIKIPPKGEFLANIARGASFSACELTPLVKERCNEMAKEYLGHGVPWIAFDILGETIQEANITCPGLLVEVAHACKKDLATELVSRLEKLI